ncbi:hypothetical protein FWK35_00019370 [Aphis craccivora]|uniref:Uncharacterized protein n=1 Tax=Aphis craccivora TaxID=307492 RepID=A0A6G0YNG2_APHCR|nr:hypothetical protein FWK35_00019370 [Aphis craccivora]
MGNVCRKSPASSTVTPPIKLFYPLLSFNVLLRASKPPLWAIVHSSKTINLQSFRTCAILLCSEILHIVFFTLVRFNVLPPSSNVAAMPEKATAKAIP